MANSPAMDWDGSSTASENASDRAGMAILLLAAGAGIAAGLAVTASPLLRQISGIEESYSLRVDLPEPTRQTDPQTPPNVSEQSAASADQPQVALSESDTIGALQPTPGSSPSASLGADQPIATGPGGMLALDYDLAQFATSSATSVASDGGIDTSMPITVNGVSSGNADIRVADNAQILIASRSLAQAIGPFADTLPPRLASSLADGTGFVPFYELRAANIDVQYDPVANRISLTLPS